MKKDILVIVVLFANFMIPTSKSFFEKEVLEAVTGI
jgi:hypothetical protein